MLAGDDALLNPEFDRSFGRAGGVRDGVAAYFLKKGFKPMTSISNMHAAEDRVSFTLSQHPTSRLNSLRAKIDAVLQDALMKTGAELDVAFAKGDRSKEWMALRIRIVREWKGWDYDDLGALVGKAGGTVKSWEQGKARVGVNAWDIEDVIGLAGISVFIQNGEWRDLPTELREFAVERLEELRQGDA